MIYFTSDTHYGHKNIVGLKVSSWDSGYRDFNSLEEMNETIIKNINKYVKEDEVLYHLGDFAFRDLYAFRKDIKCKNVHLILGNHDRLKPEHTILFDSISNYKELKIDKQHFVLMPYAMRVWNRSHHGAIHLYGHSHGSLCGKYGKSMDVGIDNIYNIRRKYRPISLNEVLLIMNKRDVKINDHHIK